MFCKNCGNKIRPGQKVCTECGAKINEKEDKINNSSSSEFSTESKESDSSLKDEYQRKGSTPREPMDSKKKKRLLLVFGSVASLVLILFIAYQVLSNMFSHEHVIADFKESVTSENAEALQDVISSDITLEEAEAYIRYVDGNLGFSQLEHHANDISSNIDNGSTRGTIHDGSFTLLEVSESGKKMGLFNQYSLTIPKHNVLLELPEEVESLQYEFENETVDMNTNNTKLEEFIPGEYNLNGTTTIGEETFDSSLNVNFSEYYDYETVFAELDLGLYYVSFDAPILYSWYDIDSEDISVSLNGEPQPDAEVNNSENSNLGPFKYGEEYKIDAALEYEGETFDIEPKVFNFSASDELDSENYHVVTLDFDEEAIQNHSDNVYEQESLEMDREMFEDDMEFEVEMFMSSYLSDLERAYSNMDIVHIEEYIIEGTETYDALQSNFENELFPNMTIWGMEIVKFERDGESIYIEVYTDRLHDDLDETVEEKTGYNILYDDETLTFKIESFISL